MKKPWDRLGKRGKLIYWSVICIVISQKDSSNSSFSLLWLQNPFHKDTDDSAYQSGVSIYSRVQMTFEGSSLLQQSPEYPEKRQNHLKLNTLIIGLLLFCSCSLYRMKCRIGMVLLLGFLRLRNPGTQLDKYFKIKINSQSPSWHAHGDGHSPESIFWKLVANSSFSRDKEVGGQWKEYRQEEGSDSGLLIFVMCGKIKLMV